MPDADTGSTQSLPVQSSPGASSSMARHHPAPSYLSARSADVILSEVRPTRLKTEALRSVNVLLDELLWLILGCARSFSPDRLRTGLLKVLPTVLGKDALLEAEVELRAYIERNPPATPLPTDEPTVQKFPLQPAFELLRIKCEAYSSLGDQEENTEVESALHARMVQIAGDAAPKLSAVAPAALYLTAILEHVCEHVLSNVGRVVARDSSRTTAHAQDLYVALCEDESIYSLFKTMKVQEQIEQQSKMGRPRRSKSFSRNDFGVETPPPVTSTDAPAVPKQRQSLDSAMSNGSNTNLSNRASVEKGRNKALFKNASSRTLTDSGNSGETGARHRRSSSLLGDKKNSLVFQEDSPKVETNTEVSPTDDDGTMQDFDDLMRSGTTMKVSLTPDRLKTFEVFAKEKNQRANRPSPVPPSPSSKDPSSPPSSFPNGASNILHKTSLPNRSRNPVESIAEAPEGDPVRSRSASIASPTTPRAEKSSTTPRSRSFTDARVPVSMSRPEIFTHRPNGQSDNTEALPTSKHSLPGTLVDTSTGPKRTQRQPARNRESMDLDDIMDGSDDDILITRKLSLTPKSAQATASGTRDLMDFLSEGPPEPPPTATSNATATATDTQRSKQGRFRTIVSRLTGSSSNERLSSRLGDDLPDTLQRPATVAINGNSILPRPPGSLHPKRSVTNVASAARSVPSPLSSPQDNNITPSGSRVRQASLTRKAVPAWETSGGILKDRGDSSLPTKPTPRQTETTVTTKPLPTPSVVSTSQPSPDDRSETVPPIRKPVPRESDQQKNSISLPDFKIVSPVSPQLGGHPLNGHAKADQDVVKSNSRAIPKTDRRAVASGLTLSIPAADHIKDLRRLVARATSVDECRVLVDMFLAKCGALPGDEGQVTGPITPPMSPIRTEVENCHESTLIEVLLGDGGSPPAHAFCDTPGSLSPTIHTQHLRTLEPVEGRNAQLRASPTLTLAPSPVVASTM